MEMLFVRILFCFFFFLHLVNPQLQINLHLTNVNEDENLQHDCLYAPVYFQNESKPRQIVSYCMGELSSKFKIKETNLDQNFTFDELSKQNITSQQLYLWSAPIDLIEQYQFYLNQLQNSEETTLSTEIYYNCTLPYFGSKCQYVLNDYKSNHSSLNEIIHDHYLYIYEPTLFTCYIHLECNRGPSPSCLDWSEICDGEVDCLDNKYDEEHCWQIEIHQCNENEYQCSDGQCISKSFFRDEPDIPDCIDQSDGIYNYDDQFSFKHNPTEPSFIYEDVKCTLPTGQELLRGERSIRMCSNARDSLLFQALFSIKPDSLSNECWTAMKCIMQMPILSNKVCEELCIDGFCDELIQNTCPNLIKVPAVPVFFGHVYFAYEKKNATMSAHRSTLPQYACYNNQLAHLPVNNKMGLSFNNTMCIDFRDTTYLYFLPLPSWEYSVRFLYISFWRFQSSIYPDPDPGICNRSTMYQCINSSKCISKSRLFNYIYDCYYGEDENVFQINKTCPTEQNLNYFKCETTNECISNPFVRDIGCCNAAEVYCYDKVEPARLYLRNTISFQTICDGFSNLLPQVGEDENETDETNCEHWPRIHVYNRCDGFWHLLDGSDEISCDSSPLLNCSTNTHICVSPDTNELICLPIEKANDGIVDCVGAADEPTRCQVNSTYDDWSTFDCGNDVCIYPTSICERIQDYQNNDDEQPSYGIICLKSDESIDYDVVKFLCKHFLNARKRLRVYFTLDQSQNLIEQNIKYENDWSPQSISPIIQSYQPRCHHGLDLQVWLDKEKNITTNICFCPPNFYGDICQYQNQRVNLILQFHVTSDSLRIPFIIIISLIDDTNERIIHSYEQFTYLPMRNCQRKYNIYLLYSTRPKNETNSYAIHIDIYEKITLNYRGSFIKPILFPFLPVHRLPFRLDIPSIIDHIEDYSNHPCVHGKCLKYFNDSNNRVFCQCEKGWSGKYCTIEHHCTCSIDSLCLGKLANNRSLCICPLNKMGPRCLIDDNICQNNKTVTCFNNGQCIPVDEYGISTEKFICINCSRGFFGDQCEIVGTKLIMSFDKNIILPSEIFIHFIEVIVNGPPVRTTTFKKNLIEKDSIILNWSLPFHLAFIELSNKTYYLIHIQKIYKQLATIEKKINSSDQCLHITKLFNNTIANSSLLHRIKYYHIPCQKNSSQLSCFYDEKHLCFCQQVDQERVTNCFEFDHNMDLNCSGQSGCKNKGQCLQENSDCPRISICRCPVCYYGAQCQFSTDLFSLSLDAILGYHIQPNVNISHQSYAVLISLILTLIITFLGTINGILSLITFKNKTTHESGCGIYLLTSSIIILLTMIVFLLKFLIFLFSQMGSITNRLFLNIQCHSIDFLLRSCLTMDQWLTAFVAIERAFVVINSVNFNKKKSKLIAKWTIIGLILITIITNILDPIYRSLFEENENEDEEKRIWCIVEYPSAARIIHLIITIIHFIIPFIANVISAILIIIMNTRQRAAIQKKQKYKKILIEQIQQHKNLLIAPCVLIILGIPRLIISFTSGCMKSSRDSWLFLVGYFISLIPSLLTFILFVLPSTIYKQAFKKAFSQYRNMMNRR